MCYAILMFTFNLIEQCGRGVGVVSTANPIGAETVLPSAKGSHPCAAVARKRKKDGWQEVIFKPGKSSLANPHYADVLPCLWLL